MPQSLEAVQAAALELSDEDRAQLVQRLLASLDRDPRVVAAWDVEIKSRSAEVEAGLVGTIWTNRASPTSSADTAGRSMRNH